MNDTALIELTQRKPTFVRAERIFLKVVHKTRRR